MIVVAVATQPAPHPPEVIVHLPDPGDRLALAGQVVEFARFHGEADCTLHSVLRGIG